MRLISLAAILPTLICVPVLSHAVEMNITSSTQYLWYRDFVADKTQNDVAEYMRLNGTKLDKDGKISFSGYGRVTKQVTSSEDLQGRLYYLYLDYRDAVKDHLDLRAGRSFVNSAAVSGTMDGLSVNLKNLGPFGVTAFGGREAIFQDKQEVGGGNAIMGGASTSIRQRAPTSRSATATSTGTPSWPGRASASNSRRRPWTCSTSMGRGSTTPSPSRSTNCCWA
ncbi:hypothetical protein FO488_05410 [Geobacter sp. FeAm09]|uniref:hypothetical protein n=1 Tax=Geobacter sp. FeAm09 TaxID=2597769 RepID=UPI0011ECEA4D|nr:hypothetical protein [Geobacter sp. FeAm09]QEM67644.1 hypothetical protein FO488_05410 [Geobacter sp. FeAm09]